MNHIVQMDSRNHIIYIYDEKYANIELALGVHTYDDGISLFQEDQNIYVGKEGIKNLIKLLTKISKEYDNTGKDK